jgi:NADH:ubiquinone oxidoreductase subunit 4 (subunit M)
MAFFGPFNERWSKLVDMTRWEQAAGAILIFFILFMGVWPAPFVDRISSTVMTLAALK